MILKQKDKVSEYYNEMNRAEEVRNALLDGLTEGTIPAGIDESKWVQGIKDTHRCYTEYKRKWFKEMQQILPITSPEPILEIRPRFYVVK